MCNPCDVSICDPSVCHDAVCFGEPSVGFIPEIILPQEREAYIRGAEAYACKKQQK